MKGGLMAQGSAVIMVLMITTVVVACVINVWWCASLTAQCTRHRQKYEAARVATQGLLAYGIALCKKNHAALMSAGDQPHELTVEQWPVNEQLTHRAVLTFTRTQQGIHIDAALRADAQAVCTIQCVVSTQKEGADGTIPMVISDWRDGSELL